MVSHFLFDMRTIFALIIAKQKGFLCYYIQHLRQLDI